MDKKKYTVVNFTPLLFQEIPKRLMFLLAAFFLSFPFVLFHPPAVFSCFAAILPWLAFLKRKKEARLKMRGDWRREKEEEEGRNWRGIFPPYSALPLISILFFS